MSDDMFSVIHDYFACFGGACVPERHLALIGFSAGRFFSDHPLVDEAATCACYWLDRLPMGSRTRLRIPN